MLLFHGTTLENAKRIQKEGFSYKKKVWTCSAEETYFFSENYFREEFGTESFSEMWDRAISETLNQARISLAIENPKIYKAAVLVFDTSLMNNADEILPDESCENMSHMAVALKNPDMNGLVAVIYSTQDERESRIIVLASLKNNSYFEMPKISEFTEQCIDSIYDTPVFYDLYDSLFNSLEYTVKWKGNDLLIQNYSREEELEVA